MDILPHPSRFISAHDVRILRQYAADAEALQDLHPAQLNVIYEKNWFNLFVPLAYNGKQLDLITALQLEEAIAWADGSTGWTVTLCSGANFFVGFLDQKLAEQIFRDNKTCFAGSGHPSGIAKTTNCGFEISGHWKYATGAPHATIFTAVCQADDQKNIPGAFLFYKDEVFIQKVWDTMGLVATASNSFEVHNLTVPASRQFRIEASFATLPGLIYQYPFLQFAETTLAVNTSGMVIRFLGLAEDLIKQKNTPLHLLHEQLARLENARRSFYESVRQSWRELSLHRAVAQQTLEAVSIASRELAGVARQATHIIYPYCGVIAATRSAEINRVWRNIHTASQHTLLLTDSHSL